MKILLLFAMKEESEKTLDNLGFEKCENLTFLNYELYKKEVQGHQVYLSNMGEDLKFKVNSVGTVPAALTAYELVKELEIDLVINPGTAGGFKSRGGNIGDIYLATEVLFHHRDIPMGDYEVYGLGHFKAFDFKKLSSKLEFKTGVFSTSDSLTCSEKERVFFEKHNVVVKEMEAAAIAYVCELAKIPYLGVKSITDIVDGDRVTSEEFLENLGMASRRLHQFLNQLIDAITH